MWLLASEIVEVFTRLTFDAITQAITQAISIYAPSSTRSGARPHCRRRHRLNTEGAWRFFGWTSSVEVKCVRSGLGT